MNSKEQLLSELHQQLEKDQEIIKKDKIHIGTDISDTIEPDMVEPAAAPAYDKQPVHVTQLPYDRPSAPVRQPANDKQPTHSNDTPAAPKPVHAKKFRHKKGLIAACAILFLLFDAIAIWKLWNKLPKNSSSAVLADANQQNHPSQPEHIPQTGDVPKQDEWSDWTDVLPSSITSDQYEIKEQTLYRSRHLETTSSNSEDSIPGWELYDTIEGTGDYGNWSDWSTTAISESASRKVETRALYRYRDKETTTGTSPTMNGWELYDTTYPSGTWGEWSEWSEKVAVASASRDVEMQHRYRYRTKETTTSSSSSKTGWMLESTTYAWGDYGNWSGWQTNAVSSSESQAVESKQQYRYCTVSTVTENVGWSSWSDWQEDWIASNSTTEVDTRTAYLYYWFSCPSCGAHMHGWNITCPTWGGGCGGATILESSYREGYYDKPYSSAADWHGTGRYYAYVEDGLAFADINKYSAYYHAPITQYRYRTMQTRQKTVYSDWSDWIDGSASGSSSQKVEYRTIYRYKSRQQVPTYHFYRWGSWSSWSTDMVFSADNREVEMKSYYRYRDFSLIPTYHFYRWGSWSAWATGRASAGNSRQAESKTEYRYCDKITERTYYFKRWGAWSEYSDQPVAESDTCEVERKIQYSYRPKSV